MGVLVLGRKRLFLLLVIILSTISLSRVFGVTTITIGVKDYSQCANDDGDGYVAPPSDQGCHWSNGNLQSNNSIYHEGDATVQRLLLEDVTIGGSHTVTFQYDTTKQGKHAYDFLTNDDYSELAPNPLTATDLCDGASSSKLPTCATAPVMSFPIPLDPLATPFNGNVLPAQRNFKLRNGTITNISTPTIVSGDYTGDSDTAITVTFTVPSNCADKYQVQGTDVCAVLFSFGAHISRQADWGQGSSAVNISGSPYHVALANIDGTSIGQRDNQMAAAAIIIVPTVTTELHQANETVVALGGSVPLGTIMHDKITVTGSNPSGSATLSFYPNGTCSGTPSATSGNLNLSGGIVDATGFAQGPLGAGTYGFKAHYNGDQNNAAADGTCENFTVNKVPLDVTTQVHNAAHASVTNTTVPLGSVVHDTAAVTGGVSGFPTPVVAFTFYMTSDCSGQGTSVANSGVEGSGVRSIDSSALAVGNYSY